MDSYLSNRLNAPLKKKVKYKLKFKTKSWITPVLQKSISTKSNLLKKNCNCKRSSSKTKVS